MADAVYPLWAITPSLRDDDFYIVGLSPRQGSLGGSCVVISRIISTSTVSNSSVEPI